MANEDVISPRKTMFVLVVVVGCFAVLWPRMLYPMFAGNVGDQIRPNKFDKEAGCCNMIFETDINAIRIMIELCGNLLERHGDVDDRTKLAFRTGKLPRDIVAKCREEVNSTCGVDISVFLDTNVRLGKSYKQLLDEVRSYNSSNCLKMNFGVPPWALGVPHVIVHSVQAPTKKFVRQERPPYVHQTMGPHPAMRERGRAIGTPTRAPAPAHVPKPPSQGPLPLGRKTSDGRVGPKETYTLTGIYRRQDEPIVPGMRPPMGGAGHIVPPPKSSTMGLFMPLYTTAIVVFFVYTLTRLLFRKQKPDQDGPYEYVESDPEFRRKVFQDGGGRPPGSRYTPETSKLVVSAISGLVAEVRQQMEESKPSQAIRTDLQQAPFTDLPHKNGSIHTKYPLEENNYIKENDSYFTDNLKRERTQIKDLVVEEETTPQIELDQNDLQFQRFSYNREPTPESLIPKVDSEETILQNEEFVELEDLIDKQESASDLNETPSYVNDWVPVIREPSPEEVSPEPEDLIEEYEIDNETELLQKANIIFREPTPHPVDLVAEPLEKSQEIREYISEEEESKIDELLQEINKEIEDDGFVDESKIEVLEEIKEEIEEQDKEPTSILNRTSPVLKEDSPTREQSPTAWQDKIGVDDEFERPESPVHRQLRSSVENDRATVKVLGMEMTASCSDGTAWGARPRSPIGPEVPAATPAFGTQKQRTPSPPVSAIFLDGPALPHQSRLLVTDSETHTEDGGDSPVVLSGKMTLSVINDETDTPERDSEELVNEGGDDEFITASAATAPKQLLQDDEEVSEEEIEEVEEELEDEEEVEEIEEEEVDEEEDDAEQKEIKLKNI